MMLREMALTRAEFEARAKSGKSHPAGEDAAAIRANSTRLALALSAVVLCLAVAVLFGVFDLWVLSGVLSIVAVGCLLDFVLVVRGFSLGRTGYRRQS
ncbi:hypothetical protein [Amycolatopsis sp.]|uniref:hypothetical protein n=1 Tax=Amycolatopsis sp. TaxID=37632 RepID=UPI002D7FBF8F|nr:hypothetical protein [Amycolatopsis sp.]